MSNIDAFVGYSFGPEDEAIVDAFLKFLDTLSETLPYFRWDHARRAEAQDLSAKVLQKMEGKNTFIGICTRKEKVIAGERFRSVWSARILPHTPWQKVEWKTSDWIMQEIGLAVGRRMNLILLLEDGTRAPGGLQGSVEYVPFDRTMVSNAFPEYYKW